jgi:signal transduction histidine kinase
MSENPPLGPNPLDLAGPCLEQAPLPMLTVEGPRHFVRQVNPAFCRLLDETGDVFVGKPFGEMFPDKGKCLEALNRVFRTGKIESGSERDHPEQSGGAWSFAMWPVQADRQTMGVMMQVTEGALIRDKTRAMNEALLLSSLRQHERTQAADSSNAFLQQEIGERKLAEAALLRAKEQLSTHAGELEGLVNARTAELAATNQQLEAFVYSIAHDLRAPLRAMQGFSELLVSEAGSALSAAGQGYADHINKSAQFMDALLRDLLAFSRISQQQVELEPVNLQSVIESVLVRLQNEIQEKNARVESPGPWPMVLAHAPTLAQVLFNLISNALKFVAREVTPRVRLRTEERAGFVRLWVVDNGIGIAADHQDQVFRPFIRLQGEKFPGTGIGLAIVQKGVERMGGRVGVESMSGMGSRFWLELKKA